jgi:hypothetical protein
MAQLSRGALNDLIANLATTDRGYREALVRDPKTVLCRQFRRPLPSSLQVEVVSDTADTVHLVLPYAPPEDGELSDADLELIGGGKGDEAEAGRAYVCNGTGGGMATMVNGEFVSS